MYDLKKHALQVSAAAQVKHKAQRKYKNPERVISVDLHINVCDVCLVFMMSRVICMTTLDMCGVGSYLYIALRYARINLNVCMRLLVIPN